jgi:ribosome-associated translation inhibitor RaiA
MAWEEKGVMNIELTGRHIEVTPAIRTHVEEHFQRIEHLFDGKPAKAHVRGHYQLA